MAKHYSPRSFFRHAPNAMLKRYSGKESRGKYCTVEPYRRGKLDYFFAYLEDYVHAGIEHDDPEFQRAARPSAFETIFVNSQDEGKVSLLMKGDSETANR